EVFVDDIQGISMMVFHTYSAKDGAHGTGCTALLSNDFSNISWSYTKPQNSTFVAFYGFNHYSGRIIHQCLRDLGDQFLHIVRHRFVCHSTPLRARPCCLSGWPILTATQGGMTALSSVYFCVTSGTSKEMTSLER